MRRAVLDIIAMANDGFISDKNFRNAIRQLGETPCEEGVVMRVAKLRQEAIYETERDLYVR